MMLCQLAIDVLTTGMGESGVAPGSNPPTIGSLFSGYGGLDMAVHEAIGGNTAWVSDIDPGACKILAHRFPGVPNLGDISAVDWTSVEPVDVLAGGFPCQDVSTAGKRLGIRPGTRSGLWTQMAYAIDQLRPSLVVIENVRGLLSAPAHSDLEPCPWCVGDDEHVTLRALGAVLGDLADLGYDASWQGLRASDVGAPHGRFRVFVVARPVGSPADTLGAAGGRDESGCVEPGAPTGVMREARWGVGRGDRARGEEIAGGVDWGAYAAAVHCWERLTRPAPDPTERGKRGQPRLSPAFVEWMMGLPDGWVTDVPGLTRNEQLKALGNGVVPQQAAEALRLLLPDVQAVAA